MMTLEYLRFGLSALCFAIGIFMIWSAITGIWRFKFALNRMHTASMADTLGLFFVILGLLIALGFQAASLKLLLIVVFMWVASPISAHLVAKLEVETDESLSDHLTIEDTTEEQ